MDLQVEHFCVKFGDPSCISFWDIMRKNKHTRENTTPMATVGMGNNASTYCNFYPALLPLLFSQIRLLVATIQHKKKQCQHIFTIELIQ